jgi:uncharacterized protein YqhQ
VYWVSISAQIPALGAGGPLCPNVITGRESNNNMMGDLSNFFISMFIFIMYIFFMENKKLTKIIYQS